MTVQHKSFVLLAVHLVASPQEGVGKFKTLESGRWMRTRCRGCPLQNVPFLQGKKYVICLLIGHVGGVLGTGGRYVCLGGWLVAV